jgi:hypothetical protein
MFGLFHGNSAGDTGIAMIVLMIAAAWFWIAPAWFAIGFGIVAVSWLFSIDMLHHPEAGQRNDHSWD